MAILTGDIDYFGSGGTSETDPNAWIGGIISTTQVTDNTDNNLFDDVTGDEASAGNLDYRGIYVVNSHGSLTLQNTVIWIETNTTSGDTAVRIALSVQGLNATMTAIADTDTEPAAVTWSTAANKAAGLSLGNIPFGQNYGVWIERNVTAAATAVNADTFVLKVEGDTAA